MDASEGTDGSQHAVVLLGRDAAPAFSGLTYASLSPRLADLAPPFVAVGTRSNGEPSGLALAVLGADGEARVASLFVVPPQRGLGLGRALLASLAEAVRRAGARTLALRIAGANASRPAVEAALTRLLWPPLACVEARVAALAGAVAEAGRRWAPLERGVLRRRGVTFDRWGPFDGDDRRKLALLAESGRPVPDADALAGQGVEPRVCVAIRRDGVLAGWLLGRPVACPVVDYADAPAIRYAGAYVEPDLARGGVLVGAIWHACERQSGSLGPRSVACYHTAAPRLVAMTRRRFTGAVLRVEEVHGTVLTLRCGSALSGVPRAGPAAVATGS